MTNQQYYTATTGLLNLIMHLENGASTGTGIVNLVEFAHNFQGPIIPSPIVNYCLNTQNNLFGNYPTKGDLAPSITFATLFGFIMLVHCIVFAIDQYRGHYFYISVIWIFYSAMKICGFALRAQWSKDITRVSLGLASEVFLIIPAVVILSANLILAQRLFTWRHPVGGSRRLFWGFMLGTYAFVSILIAVTVLASFVPYLYFLSWDSYRSWIKTVQFTSILVIAYSLTSVALIGLSFWLPTKKDELRYTYQPWWIESFAPFYFPEKGAAQRAEASFMKRNSNHRHATRVIAATHHHFHSVKGLTNKRGDLKHNISMGLLVITTVLIFISAMGRAIVVFQAREARYSSPAANKWFMYVCWGVFEVIINILYIVGRVDLRFYRPDRLPKPVREIITAEQTYYPSSDEEEDGFHRDRPETYDKIRGRAEHGYKNSVSRQEPAYPGHDPGYTSEATEEYEEDDDDTDADEDDEVNSNEWDFTVPKQEKMSLSSDEVSKHVEPPYPTSPANKKHNKEVRNDNESEFNF
ncbi:hypothetical protein KGF56_003780 [Candida oxycetoniae]|uniref:Uncharacterized protein n=1 Tax=Candida oxycetoniae TaxID=497107 RepID=A0AAI9SV82_9ASCO|nr:uncharacterized protein KGF56_003780 [Candida oxycetoniae]KAI3403496.2 hypothetical protein KGF56_003780 [Candida oxycetoniae]